MRKAKYTGRFVRVVEDQGWEVVERINQAGIVSIVAVTNNRELVLVEQVRPPVLTTVIELPSGVAGDSTDETLREAAARELYEETGYVAESWTELFEGTTSPGLTNEVVTMFFAERLSKVGEGGGLLDEGISVHTVPASRILQWLEERQRQGVRVDMKVAVAMFFVQGFK